MASLTVSNYLGNLQDDPEDAESFEGLREALASGDPERVGEQPLRLLEAARATHEKRGEARAVAWLIELEVELSADDPGFQATLLKELGRLRREELLDDAGALEAFQRALEVKAGDEEVEVAIEEIEQAAEKWRPIADRFIEEAKDASDASLKASMFARAASLVWQHRKKGRAKEVDKLFRWALKADPANTRAARLYCVTLKSRKRWKDVAEVLKSTADAARNRDEKVNLYVEAGRTAVRHLEDSALAGECYARVLDFVPGHEEALRYLVEHYTAREEWDHLVALYEDALRSRQKLESEQGVLLQIGMVHWRMRGAPDEAEPHFARLRKIAPSQPAMIEFYRDYLGAKAQSEDPATADEAKQRLLTILSDAQRSADTEERKLALAIELARAAQEAGATDRAIDAWKAVQRLDPTDADAGDALRELYRAGQKWNALVEVMRAELDALEAQSDDAEVKARRVALLRELIAIYRDELKLDVMVINTYNALLEEEPGDQEALSQLAATYEQMGRWNDLIQVLEQQAEAAESDAEKVALHGRVARLWIDRFANYNKATEPLEKVVEIEPENREALGQLKTIYTKKRAWKPLYAVLEKESALASDPTARLEMRIEMAKLAGDRLHRNDEAIVLWRGILEEAPETEGALQTLEKLSEREKDWETLAFALERKLGAEEDEKKRIKILQKLGNVYGEHLDDPSRAADAWKRILEIDPKNGRALRTLRETFIKGKDWEGLHALYAEAEDWEGLVDVLGTAADRTDDVEDKKELSFRAAAIYTEQLGNPERAFRSYERVLAVEPTNEQAARALIPIYEAQDKWRRLVEMKEILLGNVPADAPVEERLAAIEELAELAHERLGDEQASFRWAKKAFELTPDDAGVRARFEEAAARAGAWEPFVDALGNRLTDEDVGDEESLALRRKLAEIQGEKLGETGEAIAQLEQILEAEPRDADVVAVLDRLYRSEGRTRDLRKLKVHRLQHVDDADERLAILRELAQLEEDVLDDAEGAAARYRTILEIEPTDPEALEALDRLLTQGERWEALAEVLKRRRELDDADRIGLTLRLATLEREKLGDERSALDHYAEVMDARPSHPEAVAGVEALAEKDALKLLAAPLLERAYESSAEPEKLAGVLRLRLEATEDEEETRELRLRLAELAATSLGDADGAYAALEAAFLDRPSDVDLWDRLANAAEAAGKHEALATAFATAIEAGELPDGDRAALASRVAEIYDVILGEPAKAEPFHKKVLLDDPLHERAFLALKELYTTQERWDELQALYRNRIAETVDGEQKLELLLQVCFLFEEILEDPELAIRSYQEVLELEPEHYSTRRALDRLYRRTERWRDLVALLRQELDREEDERGKIDLLYEIGELHEQRLGEPTMAVDQYEQVLEKAPTHVKAQQALERLLGEPSQRQRIAATLEPLYDAQGAWGELARILEVQLEDVSDPGGQLALLTRIASLQEDKLGDAEKAMGALSKAVLADPQDPSVRQELARVAGLRGADAERAAVLEKAAEQSADSTFLHAELLLELARLYDDQLGDLDAAERTYAKLIEVDGDNPDSVLPAARALERIHMGRDEHEKLAGDLRLQIKLEFDQEKRGELLLRLATLLEEVLEDTDGAIAAHRQRLDVDPADVSAMRSLERLYEQKGEWQKLIGVLQSREASIDDAAEQEVVVQRIGEVYETKLEDLDNAIVAYNDALSRFGPHAETLVALARLYERGERWDDLLEILEMQEEQAEGEAAAELRFRRAQLMRTKTGDVERAIETYAEVLEVLPGHEGTITALEEVITDPEADYRVDAARTLVPHYEGAQAYGDLVAALEVVAESDDPLERLRSLRRAAEVAEVGAEDQAQAFALTAKAVRAGLGEPDLQDMLADLTRYAAAADEHVEHAAFLEEVAPDILDGDLQSAALLEAAAVVRARLEDRDRARALYTRVLENRPDHGGALDALDELHGEAEDWPALRDVLRRKTELAETAEERITLLERRAELDVEKLDDLPAAIDAYEQVLMEQEDRQSAYEALRRLYAKAERWTDLSATLERQLDAGVGNAVEVRHAIAEVSLEHLNDEYAALDQLREALAVDNTHAPSIALLEKIMEEREEHRGAAAEILEPVFLAQMDWPKVTATLDARLSSTDVLEERKAILAKLGQIHEDYLEDLEGALAVYGRLFREDVRDREVWETLERLGRVLDAQAELAGIYGGAIEAGGVVDEETAEVARKAGRLRAGLGESEEAVELWSRVIEFEPTDREAFQALEEAYRSLVSESKALAEAKQAEAEAPPPVPEAARASDPGVAPGEAAEESAEEAAGEAAEESAEAAEGEAAEESAEAAEGEAAEESAEAAEGEAEESAEAPDAAEPAEDPRVAAREAAREAEARAERWTESLLDLYRRRVDVAESDEERVQLLHRVADLQEDEAEVDAAIDAYRQALEHDPNDITAVEALDRLFTETERWPDLADHLRFRIDASMGGAEEADLKHRLAVLHVQRLDDEMMAVDLLEEVLQADPTHAPSIQTLEGLVLKDELKLRITQILDPIYRGQDQWKKLVAVLEAQVEMTDDPVDRVRLLGEIAQLHEDRGQDGARAFEAWARAFASDPLDEGPQKELDRLAGLLDIWDEHVAAYEAALAKTTDPMRRSQLLGTMARVHDEKRGDPRAAIETYERLAENDPDDVSALDALEALHTMVADWRGLVEVIDRKVERSFEPAERAELLRRAASVLEELLGDPKGAIDLYERAAQEDDQDPVALEALDRLYAAHSEHEQLARVLRRRVEVEEDAELKVEIGLRLGQLHETQLQQPEDAIDAYVGVLDVESGQKDAIAALSRLYERQALWPELLENLKLQAGLAENVDERVAFMHRAGEVTERELDDVLEAITLYEQVLELDNRHEPALEALVRISQLEDYRAQAAEILEPLLHLQERWDLLADLKKLKADAALDPLDKKQELIALAQVRENGLQDTNGAFDALARALGEDPSDEELAENLERLAAATDGYGKLADTLASRASAALDPIVARGLYVRLARIAEERLEDDARAVEAYQRALEQVGDDVDLLGALDRLHVKTESWTPLSEVLERRISMADDPTERAALLVRLGELREKQFGDLRGAFAAYQEVVERDPGHDAALDGLQRLGENEELALDVVDTLETAFRETGAMDRIAGLYDIRIHLADTDGERVQMLQEAAQLWENDLGQPDKALASMRKAFEIDPRDEMILEEVERLATASGAWESLRGMIEKVAEAGDLDRELGRELNLRAARWYRDQLGDGEAAEGRLRAAIEADPEASEAHRQLVELLRVPEREADLVAALRAWAEIELDEFSKKDRLREAARLAESALQSPGVAGECYEAILEIDGSDAEALGDLGRIRQSEGRWDAVVPLLEKRIEVEMDPEERLGLRRQLAEVFAGPLEDAERATSALEGVLEEAPEDLEAIGALEPLYEQAERWDDLRGLLDRRLEIATSDEERVAARVRLARLMEKAFGKRDEAMSQLREILEIDPSNGEALDELGRLLEAEESWDELAVLLERRADDAAALGDVATQKGFLVRLAGLHEEQREDLAAAGAALDRVLTLDPQDVAAVERLAGLHEAQGEWAAVAEDLERLRGLQEPAEAAKTSLRIAELAEEKLEDPARAAGALVAANELQPSEATRELLKGHYEKHEEWAALAQMLDEELAGIEEDAAKVAHLKRIADLYMEKLGDAATGVGYLERAAELTPDDREVLLPLCDLYIEAGRQQDAVPVLEKIIESFGTRRSKELAQYHHRLGRALEGMGDQEGALKHYDAAFKIDLTNVAILRDLGKLTHRQGDLARAQKTFRALLLQKLDESAGITKADVYFYLGDISHQQGDARKAKSMLDRAVSEDAEHAQAKALLEQIG